MFFNVRQDGGNVFRGSWSTAELAALEGREHEILFTCQGETVAATLDGKAHPLSDTGHSRKGRIQFNFQGSSLLIKSMEYRDRR